MLIQERGPKPEELDTLERDRPELDWLTEKFARLCQQIWNDLGADRQLGFGVMGCIPHGAIVRWCRGRDLDTEATDTVVYVLRKQDANRVEREQSKQDLADA